MAQRITPRATKTTSSSRRLPQKSPDSSRYGGGIRLRKPLCRCHFFALPLSRDNTGDNDSGCGVTSTASSPSTTTARSLIHCSSVIGLSDITYLPVTCSSCHASRQCVGSLFFIQKIALVGSGGQCSMYGTMTLPARLPRQVCPLWC
jgi:hypothetical protein